MEPGIPGMDPGIRGFLCCYGRFPGFLGNQVGNKKNYWILWDFTDDFYSNFSGRFKV